MKKYSTPQEEFWAGEFGNDYVDRSRSSEILASNIALFSRILGQTQNVESVMELGANIGMNLRAIASLLPGVELSAVEINEKAAEELEKLPNISVYKESILDYNNDLKRDFVLMKGVLIHLDPGCLNNVYDLLYRASRRYICIAEYYNPSPVTVKYRGHDEKLFKRDFAGELMGRFNDLRLNDYGFVYHKDPNFPQDDITWFLLEKTVAGR